jgi:precorrin isomerase
MELMMKHKTKAYKETIKKIKNVAVIIGTASTAAVVAINLIDKFSSKTKDFWDFSDITE